MENRRKFLGRGINAAVFFVLFFVTSFAFLLTARIESPRGQVAGVDYVPGEVILSLAEVYMPGATDVSSTPPGLGIAELDSIFQVYGGTELRKLHPTYDRFTSPEGRLAERTFTLHYHGEIDALDLVSSLSQLPYFDYVGVNHILHIQTTGTRRFIPGSTTEFNQQWNLDGDEYHPLQDERVDIDMPEAWEVQHGDTSLIIGIIDTGTMLDTTSNTNSWVTHNDFNLHWINAEDSLSPAILNGADLDSIDNNGDGRADNIIGTRFLHGCHECSGPDQAYKERFWHAMPHNWFTQGSATWDLLGWSLHGTWVGSIAAAQLESHTIKDIVGVAHDCQVYNVRFSDDEAELHQAIVHTAGIARVINMSFKAEDAPMFKLATEIASNDLDCLLIAAAGNKLNPQEPQVTIVYPAKYDSVMAIGAITRTNTPDLPVLTYYSRWDTLFPLIDLVAPVNIGLFADQHSACDPQPYPCDITEETGVTQPGTSFAAPQVTGVAALLRLRFPALNQYQVKQRLKRSGEYYWDSDPDGKKKYGYGKVNAYRALTEWGSIEGSVTWSSKATAAPGEIYTKDDIFYVSGDLTIEVGAMLTINKGVTVKIAPDHEKAGSDPVRVQIIVNGTLKALGTAANPIVFESFTDFAPAKDDWVGIRFESTSSGNVLDRVIVRNAQVGIENYAPVTLTNCTIDSCEIGVETHANADIRNSTITNCEDNGVRVVAGNAYLFGDTISNAGFANVYAPAGIVSIRDCYIAGGAYGIWANSTSNTDSVIVNRTTVENNTAVGLYLKWDTAAEIDSSQVRLNDRGIVAWFNSEPVITNSMIDTNTTDGILCYVSSIDIRGNHIESNPVGVFCLFNSDSEIRSKNVIRFNNEGIVADNSDVVVESTTVTFNDSVGVTAKNGANPDLGQTSGGLSKGRNVIHNNTDFEVRNETDTVTVKAEKNYWGDPNGPDPTKIFGDVDYTPWLHKKPDINPSPFGVSRFVRTQFPATYELSYGYPNPFNPVTRIRYEIPEPGGRVRILIYNVRGQVVRRLLDEPKAPGVYRMSWDGRSDRGDAMASGVYFLRMSAGTFVKTRKIVLLK